MRYEYSYYWHPYGKDYWYLVLWLLLLTMS